jgi:hypothetical protein
LLLICLGELQVSPHEIVVIKDEHYMELWLEMGDWVEDNGIDDAPKEPVAANTVYIYLCKHYPLGDYFGFSW